VAFLENIFTCDLTDAPFDLTDAPFDLTDFFGVWILAVRNEILEVGRQYSVGSSPVGSWPYAVDTNFTD
jgi:hypothetical protein